VVNDNGLEVFSFKDLFKADSLLFWIHSGSGREREGNSVV